MHLFYRISDKSYEKDKLEGATKEVCLMNFISSFRDVIFNFESKNRLTIIADRCSRATNKMLLETNLPVVFTDEGNAGSIRYAFKLAVELEENEMVYFCEDDYLHLSNAPEYIEEGLSLANYTTLYDHPDKYLLEYNKGEFSKVMRTPLCHWKHTISTCMTFGVKVKTLKEDMHIWEKHIQGNHPNDHYAFVQLRKDNKRTVSSCIPGRACHTDLELSKKHNKNLIDKWAIEMMKTLPESMV